MSRENLGETPSLVAGASLLTDYILTVAVSVAGGVLAIQSAFGFDSIWRVPLCLVLIAVMTIANLRGLKESGAAVRPADVPVHRHAGAADRGRAATASSSRTSARSRSTSSPRRPRSSPQGTQALSLLMLLRAFSSGAVALSGVEAVSNGVPAFRKPESRNAAMTIAIMGAILGTCFLGVSVLASHLQPYRGENDPTGIALMAEYIYGGKGVLFWVTQIATFAILILAANTAYADFPRLSSIIARDGYLPRQLANRGDRLVFSNGIIFLALMAGVLIVVFKGNISALIPLYAFGVFTGFTLSQAGMVVHHFRLREPRWRLSAAINAVGCVATGIVAIVVVVSKFTEGAWIPAVVIPALVVGFRAIARHYRRVARGGAPSTDYRPPRRTHSSSCSSAPSTGASSTPSSTPDRWHPSASSPCPSSPTRRSRSGSLEAWARVRHAGPAAHDRLAVPGADPAPCSSTSTSSTPRAPTTSSPSSSPSSSRRGRSSGCTTSRRSPSRPACCTARTPSSRRSRCWSGEHPAE